MAETPSWPRPENAPTFTVHQVGNKDRELFRTPYSDVAEALAQAWLKHRLGDITRSILERDSTDTERKEYDLIVRRDGEFHARYGWRREKTLVLTENLDPNGQHRG